MGDISRHRDIFLNTRATTPASLLAKVGLTAGELTYLELGNYLVRITVPDDHIVGATGVLLNPREVLSELLGFDDGRIERLAADGVVQLGD